MARETDSTHEVNTFAPLSFDDVKGQLVEVYDAKTGKVDLTAPASPILDGGGNVAISPSAQRVAVLDAGAIQVYELAAPGLVQGLPTNWGRVFRACLRRVNLPAEVFLGHGCRSVHGCGGLRPRAQAPLE